MRAIKRKIAGACGRALRRSGMSARFFSRRTPIVFYHGIWPAGAPALQHLGGITRDQLRADLAGLARHFELVSLEALLRYNRTRATSPRPPLAVCFDDGCEMIRSGALGVLDELEVPATMFVVTASLDNRHLMWMHKFQAIQAMRGEARLVEEYNRLMQATAAGPPIEDARDLTPAAWCWPMPRKEEYVDELYRACEMPPVEDYLDEHRPYMTWDDLRAWCRHGHGVGVHTASHPFCDRLAASEVEAEILAPAALLRRELDLGFVPFAYPFGNRLAAESEISVAQTAGFSCMLGVTGLSRRGTDPRRLGRVEGERGLDVALFGAPLLELALARLRTKPTLSVSFPKPAARIEP